MGWTEILMAVNNLFGTDESRPLNEVIIERTKEYTRSGTFKVPRNVTRLSITACAAGDDGGDGGDGEVAIAVTTTTPAAMKPYAGGGGGGGAGGYYGAGGGGGGGAGGGASTGSISGGGNTPTLGTNNLRVQFLQLGGSAGDGGVGGSSFCASGQPGSGGDSNYRIITTNAYIGTGSAGGNGGAGGAGGQFCWEYQFRCEPEEILTIIVGEGNTIIKGKYDTIELIKGYNLGEARTAYEGFLSNRIDAGGKGLNGGNGGNKNGVNGSDGGVNGSREGIKTPYNMYSQFDDRGKPNALGGLGGKRLSDDFFGEYTNTTTIDQVSLDFTSNPSDGEDGESTVLGEGGKGGSASEDYNYFYAFTNTGISFEPARGGKGGKGGPGIVWINW